MAARTLRVYLDGTLIGTATQSSQGSLGFNYDGEYIVMDDPTPLSLSLPVLSNRHRDKAVRAYMEGLLPDSEGARQRWASEYHVSPNNPFTLLAHVGRDAAGAVQILPPRSTRPTPGPEPVTSNGSATPTSPTSYRTSPLINMTGTQADSGAAGASLVRNRRSRCSGTHSPGSSGSRVIRHRRL